MNLVVLAFREPRIEHLVKLFDAVRRIYVYLCNKRVNGMVETLLLDLAQRIAGLGVQQPDAEQTAGTFRQYRTKDSASDEPQIFRQIVQ